MLKSGDTRLGVAYTEWGKLPNFLMLDGSNESVPSLAATPFHGHTTSTLICLATILQFYPERKRNEYEKAVGGLGEYWRRCHLISCFDFIER